MKHLNTFQKLARMSLKMKLKAKVLLVWNTIFLVPIILYMVFWFILSIFVVAENSTNILAIVFVILIAVLLYSIFSAIRLKLRILKDVGDNFLAPVKSIYIKAFLVNIGGYLVFYPLILSLFSQSAIAILFIFLAIIIAIPMLRTIRKAEARYKRIKREMHIGRGTCKKCKVSLFYNPNYRQWICYKCGTRF